MVAFGRSKDSDPIINHTSEQGEGALILGGQLALPFPPNSKSVKMTGTLFYPKRKITVKKNKFPGLQVPENLIKHKYIPESE